MPTPLFTANSRPRILPTAVPVPAPTLPSAGSPVAASQAAAPSAGPGRRRRVAGEEVVDDRGGHERDEPARRVVSAAVSLQPPHDPVGRGEAERAAAGHQHGMDPRRVGDRVSRSISRVPGSASAHVARGDRALRRRQHDRASGGRLRVAPVTGLEAGRERRLAHRAAHAPAARRALAVAADVGPAAGGDELRHRARRSAGRAVPRADGSGTRSASSRARRSRRGSRRWTRPGARVPPRAPRRCPRAGARSRRGAACRPASADGCPARNSASSA